MSNYIIYTDMVGDLCHMNHIIHLEKCKKFKENCLLYVGLHSDEESKKWKRIPVLNITEREYIFKSLKMVDKVIINATIVITEEFIKKYNIDMVIHAHSENENKKYYFHHEHVLRLNKFTRFDYNDGLSTTDIINRIKNRKY